MTEYFEVHDRDGAARLGELRLADPIVTPGLVDDVLVDAGSLWASDVDVPEGDESTLTVLPHRGFPSGTDPEVEDAFAVDHPVVEFPSAAVVSPRTAADVTADAYVLAGAPGYVNHAEAFVDAIVRVRDAIPGDTALVLSGVATPGNVATLASAGVDLVDTTGAVVAGTEGRYLTREGTYFLEDLEEYPCPCPACTGDVDQVACVEHNVNALEAELATVRRQIRDGRLRDYLEGQARHDAWTTGVLRRFDQQYGYLEERTPVARNNRLLAATEDAMRRVEIQRFADRVTSRYRNRFDQPLVLVPCSAAKPYSESQSHKQYRRAIAYRGHLVSMTSPIGVVPMELELTYPAQHYDSVVTGRWSATEQSFVSSILERYLERTRYSRVIAHVPDEGYRDIVERVESGVDVPFEYTVVDHPTTEASLEALDVVLEGESTYRKREREHNTVRAIADYQFGDGDAFFGDIRTDGRYPKLTVDDATGEQLAAVVPQYGLLALTLAGGRRWVESDVPVRRVEIDAFVPSGSVLAPGVVDASDDIRVGDEVVVEGPKAFAVGRAAMTGREMTESTRGIAVDVRHAAER